MHVLCNRGGGWKTYRRGTNGKYSRNPFFNTAQKSIPALGRSIAVKEVASRQKDDSLYKRLVTLSYRLLVIDIIQFADDTSFHFSRKNVNELVKCVSEILEKTDNYLMQNKLTMNTRKTELFFVSKENENFDPIVFRGQENKPQSHCRYLGIMIDSKLNFHVQLNKVLSNMATANRSIYLSRY